MTPDQAPRRPEVTVMIDADLTNDVARRVITNRYVTDFDLDHDFLSVRRIASALPSFSTASADAIRDHEQHPLLGETDEFGTFEGAGQ